MSREPIGKPCDSCGTTVVTVGSVDGLVVVEVPHQDGRTQRMSRHTPERCRAARGDAS